MLGKEVDFASVLAGQPTSYIVCEAEAAAYVIDCYPYAIRGLFSALALVLIFWGSVAGLLLWLL